VEDGSLYPRKGEAQQGPLTSKIKIVNQKNGGILSRDEIPVICFVHTPDEGELL